MAEGTVVAKPEVAPKSGFGSRVAPVTRSMRKSVAAAQGHMVRLQERGLQAKPKRGSKSL